MRLAELMALHLHQLRKPALEHFSKLISLSGKAYFLEETLRQQRHTSFWSQEPFDTWREVW